MLNGTGFIDLTREDHAYFFGFFCAQVLAITGAVRTAKPNTRDRAYNPMVANDPAASLARWLYPADCLALERKRRAAAEVSAWIRPATMRATARCRRWTAEDDAVVLAMSEHDAAIQLGRTRQAVHLRCWRLRTGRAVPGDTRT